MSSAISTETQNRSFSGCRKPRSEVTTLVSRNTKAGYLSAGTLRVSGKATLDNDLSVAGFSTLSSGLQLGTDGTNLYKIVSGTASVDPGNIGATTKGSVNVTITGLAVTDRVILHPPTGLNGGILYCGCDVTAANTLTIYLYNTTNGAIDDGANTWKYSYLDFTN